MKKYILILTINILFLRIDAKEHFNYSTVSAHKPSIWNPAVYSKLIKLKMTVKNINSYEFSLDLNTEFNYNNFKWLSSKKNSNRFISSKSQYDSRFQNLNINAETIIEKNKTASITKDFKIKF